MENPARSAAPRDTDGALEPAVRAGSGKRPPEFAEQANRVVDGIDGSASGLATRAEA
jgi:hypothetical protein